MGIPITICVDAQGLVPMKYFPEQLQILGEYYVREFKDELMGQRPVWFQSVIACELVLQLPFFFVAIYAFWKGKNWIRGPLIAYLAHVCTTLVPIVTTFVTSEHLSTTEMQTLLLVYGTWIVLPVWMLLLVLRTPQLFVKGKKED
eukprot:JP438337.1.p2 GENE.JP438337.1~~JP438337.1.p2  ORF type:complete len:145 (-),score=25.36 JP438337.1:42-476(-)